MFIEITILAILLATFAFIVPPGGGPELAESVDDPTAGPASEPAVEPASGEAEPSPALESEASMLEGAGGEPEAEAEEPAAEPVVPSYGRDNEVEMQRQRADRAERQLNESLAAQRRAPASTGLAPTTAPVPLVQGMADEDLDPQTRAVLLGQRQTSENLDAIRAENKELRDRQDHTQATANMATQDREAERVVNNLINEIDVFKEDQNPEVAKMVREDLMAGVRAGHVTAANVSELVLQQARRYAHWINSKAETPRDKVQAAIERKAQADDSTSLGKPASTPASSKHTKEEEAKLKDQSNPRRFAGIIKKTRERMQAAGNL